MANGTEALHLALRALDVGPGDEVITSANTFAATAFAILHAGATPVFVDVDPFDCNIDVSLIERATSKRRRRPMRAGALLFVRVWRRRESNPAPRAVSP